MSFIKMSKNLYFPLKWRVYLIHIISLWELQNLLAEKNFLASVFS